MGEIRPRCPLTRFQATPARLIAIAFLATRTIARTPVVAFKSQFMFTFGLVLVKKIII
jgi:hypothetical protein